MSATPKVVMIVHADDRMRATFGAALRRGYRTLQASSGEAAVASLTRDRAHVVLLGMRLPGIDGFDTLRILSENFSEIEVVAVLDSRDGEDVAETAMRLGAFKCVARSADGETIRTVVRRACERQGLNASAAAPNLRPQPAAEREFVVGSSAASREVVATARKVARLSATVLILGESGTGKELLARMIHRESGLEDAPFVPVNLAAIPRELVDSTLFGHEKGSFTGALRQQIGKFELAAGGTLFLDEVGDLRVDLQAKLLRAIQEGEIERVGGMRAIQTSFRLIAATNRDLDAAVKDGTFREDLYYRLNVIPIRMPALRERIEDLPDLVRCFVARYSSRFGKPVEGFSDAAIKMLSAYWWPGNIRELENLVERLVATADKSMLEQDDVPFDLHFARLDAAVAGGAALLNQACAAFERRFILKALEKSSWNVAATARYLGVPLSTLKYRIDRLDVRELAKRFRRN